MPNIATMTVPDAEVDRGLPLFLAGTLTEEHGRTPGMATRAALRTDMPHLRWAA
jgi:hypothetical protein